MKCSIFGVIKAKTGHYLMKIVQTLRGDWMSEKRFVLVNKYNTNELMIDNLFVMNGIPQLYDAECVVSEMNSMNDCLNGILGICDDVLKIKDNYDVGYCVGVTEIKKLVEDCLNVYDGD